VVTPYYADDSVTIYHGEALALLRVVEDVAGPVFATWLAVFQAIGR